MRPSWLTEQRCPHVLGLLRVALAALLGLYTLKLARGFLRAPYFGDVFHLPLLPESWVPSRAGYALLLVLQGLGCVFALLGVQARAALGFAATCGLYGLFCDRLQYHNNRYQLLLLALLVSFTPCDRSWRAWRKREGDSGPRWAVRAAGAQVSLVYLASSLGKLLDPDWRGGSVLLLRFASAGAEVSRYWQGLAGALSSPRLAQAAALGAISSELFIALGLWFQKTRALALWLGVVFHVGVELTSRVELFSYTMLAGYVVFVTPELRERTLIWRDSEAGRTLATLCARLDLLARFRHERATARAPLLRTRDREGTVHDGLAALRELARGIPLLFPLWLPLRLVPSNTRASATQD